MDKPSQQELLPPISEHRRILDWLTKPQADALLVPLTGLWIIGLDWLLFSEDAATLGLTLPLTVPAGFLVGAIGAYQFQRRFGGDSKRAAWIKAILAGIVVGIPFPLTGTVVGGWVLAKSGLLAWRDHVWRRK
jgi:hypothetical protein